MGDFTVKDSGAREEFESGMVRDTTEGKIDYSLVLDGPMFRRLAIHLTKGALKYAKRNWMKARGQEELDRFRESALRHFLQWYDGDTDEDHAAAVIFNINGAEYVKAQQAPAVEAAFDVLNDDHLPASQPVGRCTTCECRSPHCHTGVAESVYTTVWGRVVNYRLGKPCHVLGCRVPGEHEGLHVFD